FIALHQGEAEQAHDLARQFLQGACEINNKFLQATALAILAGARGALGYYEQAARLLGASEGALERLGAFLQPNDQQEVDGMMAATRAQLDEAIFQAAWAEGRALTLEQAVARALDVRDA
ncbi:MAG TPA: hypothetical protein VH590_13510, partial [Ktedonobacterales bacterium]